MLEHRVLYVAAIFELQTMQRIIASGAYERSYGVSVLTCNAIAYGAGWCAVEYEWFQYLVVGYDNAFGVDL